MSGVTTMIGGGTGPAAGTNATTCTPGPWNIARMLQAADALPMNLGFLGKGNASLPEALVEQMRAGCIGPEAARGLGHHPGGHRHLPARGRQHDVQVAIHTDTLNESGFVEDTHRRLQGPGHPHLPHRGRGRRPRPRHHQGVRRAERAALVDQPDPALHGQHHRRAPGHADGLPPPRSRHRRGRGLRRVAHPARDHRRRGHPARPGRLQHDLLGLAGDGAGGRGDHPHLADRPQDEGAARRRCPATAAAQRQLPRQALRRQVHHQPGASPTASPTRSARSRWASWPTWCCGSRRSSASSRRWCSRAA